MRPSLRPLAVITLTAIAIAVPAVAWWLVGSAESERQATHREDLARERSASVAQALATRLSDRLQALADSESRRPFYQYRNLYHDPEGASVGASVVPSPLAAGPSDPLVSCHFQVDAQGRLTLPTVNDELPELSRQGGAAESPALRAELTAAAPALVAAVRRAPIDAAGSQMLASGAWDQISSANWLYASLKNTPLAGAAPERPMPTAAAPPVVVCVGPLEWRTVQIGGVPALVALRDVETPDGVATQGLRLDLAGAAAWITAGGAEARLLPGRPVGGLSAPLALGGTDWHLTLDAPPLAAAGLATAEEARASFRRTYALGTGFALLAGAGVVLLALRSDRLARERSRFAAAAAHELRTPLASLRLYGDLLAKGIGDPERVPAWAARISTESDRLGRVVSNVLAFSLGEEGEPTVRPTRGDLAAAVADCAARLAPAFASSGLRLDVAPVTAPVTALFDAEALERILANLFDNADRYTRTAADRTVSVTVEERRRNGRAGDLVVALVAVDDAGPGVPRARREQIFRPFARVADPNSPAGLGIGLALARSLARSMGGELTCHEGQRGGARFELELPTLSI